MKALSPAASEDRREVRAGTVRRLASDRPQRHGGHPDPRRAARAVRVRARRGSRPGAGEASGRRSIRKSWPGTSGRWRDSTAD